MPSQMQMVQGAIYNALTSSSQISEKFEGAIYDTVPSHKSTPELYMIIGADQSFDQGSKTHEASRFLAEVSMFSKQTGLSEMKAVADLVVDVLSCGELDVAPAKLVYSRLKNCKTVRTRGGMLNIIKIQFSILIDTTISQ